MVEEENFHRFCGILLDTGAKVLREVFLDKYVGTSTLVGYLACHKQNLSELLPNTVRKEQFDLLFPSGGGAPVIEDFDLTLLCVLFRHLDTQTTPYDTVWTDPKNDQTYQSDVTRIRLIRNMLSGHFRSASMCNTTYSNEVSNLTSIFHSLVHSLSPGRMSSTELREMMDRELNGPLKASLNRKVAILKEEMQELYKGDEDFRKAVENDHEKTRKVVKELSEKQEEVKKELKYLQERTENQEVAMDDMRGRIDRSKVVMDKHRNHASEFFVENQRYKTAKMILDLHGKILITGKQGQGKTYLAYQLLLKFIEDKKTVSPLIISSANEWTKLVDPSIELCIVVEDMCGKHAMLQGELKNWNANAKFIRALINKRKHTVIFTMRTHIYEEINACLQLESDISDPLLSENITLNLDNESVKLLQAEKIEFANRYLNKFGLTEDEVLHICGINEASIGFPLLCREAQSMEDRSKLFDLFSRPSEIILRELENLCKEKSVSYGVLVLTMLSGGKLTSKSINEYSVTSDGKKEVKLIFDSYGRPDVSLADVQQAAKTLCGTYLSFSESDESYSFVHDVVAETVRISYGKLCPL